MFYHYQTITERKYGIATVWLVATLGSKTTISRKLQKKDIMDVNLPKACKTIIHPETPLALRLQSTLLYGISRVYREQYNYFQNDVQNAHLRLSKEYNASNFQAFTLDVAPSISNSRSSALMLQDDPSFVPELAYLYLPSDFCNQDVRELDDIQDVLSFSSKTSKARMMSPASGKSFRSHGKGIDIPSSSSRGLELHSFDAFDEGDYPVRTNNEFDANPDFAFDEQGNIQDIFPAVDDAMDVPAPINLDEYELERPTGVAETVNLPQTLDDNYLVSEQILRDHKRTIAHLDLDDIEALQRESNPHYPRAAKSPRYSGDAVNEDEKDDNYRQESSTRSASEPPAKRRRRTLKLLPIDPRNATTIQNAELARAMTNYVSNMQELNVLKKQRQTAVQAKSYAHNLIYGWKGTGKNNNIKERFSGHNILMFFNNKIKDVSKKTNHGGRSKNTSVFDEDANSMNGITRHRRHDDSPEFGMSVEMQEQNNGIQMDYDENQASVDDAEIGRYASSQPDTNVMPWNVSINRSRAGSVFSVGGIGSSSVAGIPSSALRGSRAYTRILSTPIRSPAIVMNRLPGSERLIDYPDPMLAQQHSPFGEIDAIHNMVELEAVEDAHIWEKTKESQGNLRESDDAWFSKIMEKEGQNFLEFVKDHLTDHEESGNSLSFDNLLKPEQTNRIVAVQAFHHVLTLATNNVVSVNQIKPFDSIWLTIL